MSKQSKISVVVVVRWVETLVVVAVKFSAKSFRQLADSPTHNHSFSNRGKESTL